MSTKKRMCLGKGDRMDLSSLSWECKMKLGLREKRIGTDELFKHGILTTGNRNPISLHFIFPSSLRESQTYH